MVLKIDNRQARKLWLSSQGLALPPTGPLEVIQIIKDLGFVQLDTIRNVTRAHHHILWSRNQNYREPMLGSLLARDRSVFEHFTHDASVLPVEFYPMWKRQFRRMKDRIDCSNSNYYDGMLGEKGRAAILTRIENEGPLSTHDFDSKAVGEKAMWSRPPHKIALDYMWYAGELATSHRQLDRPAQSPSPSWQASTEPPPAVAPSSGSSTGSRGPSSSSCSSPTSGSSTTTAPRRRSRTMW